jgi:hypothetical protein
MLWGKPSTPAPRELDMSHRASMVLSVECKLMNRLSASNLELTSYIRLQNTANFGESILYSYSDGPQ